MHRTLVHFLFLVVITTVSASAQGWEGDVDENGQLHGHAMKLNANGLPIEEAEFRHGVLHGLYIKSDENMNAVIIDANYRDGLLHGDYFSNFADNVHQRESEGTYDNGQKVGEWRHFFRSGRKSLIANYVNGFLHGPYIEYFDAQSNGEDALKQRVTFANGVKNGTSESYFDNAANNLLARGEYLDDEKIGYWETWHPNGKIQLKEQYYGNILIGTVEKYYPSGSMDSRSEYANGVLNGTYERFYDNSEQLAEQGVYINGKKNGTWTFWNVRGVKTVEAEYRLDVLDGRSIRFDDFDGSIKEINTFQNGLKHGQFREYLFPGPKAIGDELATNGEQVRITVEGGYSDDKRTGEWSWYHPNGQLKRTGSYDAGGFPDGTFLDYDELGDLVSVTEYEGEVETIVDCRTEAGRCGQYQ